MAFTTEQVAAYIRDQGLSPAEAQMAAQAFGISSTQLAAAQAMLKAPDQTAVNATSQAYATNTSAAQKAENDRVAAEQLARDQAAQQAELARIQAVRDADAKAAREQAAGEQVARERAAQQAEAAQQAAKQAAMERSERAAREQEAANRAAYEAQVASENRIAAEAKAAADARAAADAKAATPVGALTQAIDVPETPKFTTEQVAAYIRDQKLTAAEIPAVAQAFNISPTQVAAAQTLLQQPDQTAVNTVSNTYAATVAAQPELKTQNDTWVREQLARDQAAQQAEFYRIAQQQAAEQVASEQRAAQAARDAQLASEQQAAAAAKVQADRLAADRVELADKQRRDAAALREQQLVQMNPEDLLKQDRATLPADFQRKFDDFTELKREEARRAEAARVEGLIRMNPEDLLKQDRATLPPDLQQRFDSFAEDQRVQAQRNAAVTTNTQQVQAMPTFTAAQVAAYITDNGIKSADYLKVAGQFGVPVSTVVEAMNLMANKDPSIKAASTAYDTAIAANPAQGALNNAFEVSKGLTPTNVVSGTANTGSTPSRLVTPGDPNSPGYLSTLPPASGTTRMGGDWSALPGETNQQTADRLKLIQGNYSDGPYSSFMSTRPTGVTMSAATPTGGLTQGATNPGKFTAEQVASYIKEQNVPPVDYAKTAAMFGIPTDLLNQGVALLTQNDPSVTAATTAYNAAIAANPAQGAANNSWVNSQAANTPAQQAATLNAIDTVKSPTGALTQTQGTTMPITDNPGNLTAAQVAAYIRDQGVKPADYATTAQAFGIPMSLLTQGLYLLAKNDPSVQATSTAYSNAVAANPAQGATNNAWVAQQLAAPSSVQQNTLGVIDAYKNNAPASNPSGFTAAQVAAYIRDQKIAPTDYAKTAAMFGIDPALLSAGVTLLNSGSSTVNDASNAYAHIVGDDPSKGVRNNAWVAGQTAKTPAEQQAELDRIAGVKATTNPGKFDAMHVAAFLKDQNIKAADYGKFANMFGIDAGLLSDGVSLLDSNNPGVTSVSDLYKATIAGTNQGALNDAWVASQAARNPTGQAQELFGISGVKTGGAGTYNPGTGTGLTRVPTTTDPIINPTVGPLTTKTAPLPAPSTAANSFDTPVLNALYTQQRQNMTSQAPAFNFQAKAPVFKNGGLTRAIKGY